MSESCENCRFARIRDFDLVCCRRAPTAFALQGVAHIVNAKRFQNQLGEFDQDEFCELGEERHADWFVHIKPDAVTHDAFWPEVREDDWCGEWAATPEVGVSETPPNDPSD